MKSPARSFSGLDWIHIFKTGAAIIGVPVLMVALNQIQQHYFDLYEYVIALSGFIGYLIKKWATYYPE